MFEFVIAHLLFQVAACAALMLLASGSAALDLRGRRDRFSTLTHATISSEPGVVVELPAAPRLPKPVHRHDVEAQSEAA